jgi:hypothetical protein
MYRALGQSLGGDVAEGLAFGAHDPLPHGNLRAGLI